MCLVTVSLSMVERNREWEEKPHTIRAYNVGRSVYYIQHGSISGENPNPDDDYYLLYWPRRKKHVETVSVLETYEEKENALAELEQKAKEKEEERK